MRKIFLLPVVLLCAFALVTWSCGGEPTDETCDNFGQDIEQGSCVIPADANVCCDETSCTLSLAGENYTCNNPNMDECINNWVDAVCGNTKSASDREVIYAAFKAITSRLMNEARLNSVCR